MRLTPGHLMLGAAPNPRLQRTRSAPLRSPLSRKPFGERGNDHSGV
jgi:hypothetical protein